jgi:hypothetical protein
LLSNYDLADITTFPSALKSLIELFGSVPMFTILGSLTGLTAENDDDENEGGEDSAYEPSLKKHKSSNGSVAMRTFSSCETLTIPLFDLEANGASASNTPSSAPRWHFELRRWKHTHYSLSFDTDVGDGVNDEKNGALDVMLFFNYPTGLDLSYYV